MYETARYLELVKQRYGLTSDYALAAKLGIAQPDANLIRRGLKVPKPEVCIAIANLLGRNPVELLLTAQKDKAPPRAKEYWRLALTAVDVMLHVPKRPHYLAKKIEAIGRELRQLESQTLTYEGAAANAEAVRLVETSETSIDSMMERWNIWKKGEPLYPNYLLANQAAVRRGVKIRRLLIVTADQMTNDELVADAVQIMDDQAGAGISIFYAFRESLLQSSTFQRLEEDFRKYGAAQDLNAAMFDRDILIFSQTYGTVPLGVVKKPKPITMINRLKISWKPEMLRALDPAPLFDMTRYVFEYEGPPAFHKQLSRFRRSTREVPIRAV